MSNYVKKSVTKATKSSIRCINPYAAGIDVGANSIFVCSNKLEIKEFSTFTQDLKNMVLWLKKSGTKTVAMESTGVYWIPIYDILEECGFEVFLVNARHVKNVPGRKTDVKDCQWLQQLHSYGLLGKSFRPEANIVILRCYVRQRSRQFEAASQQVQLMHKALSQLNIKLSMVISDITGLTGMNIMKDIVNGERDLKKLASHRSNLCKKSKEEIYQALEGNYKEEHIFSLNQAIEAYEFFHNQVLKCEQNIEKICSTLIKEDLNESVPIGTKALQNKTQYNRSPYSFDVREITYKMTGIDLTEIPGIDGNSVIKILSEVGTDMSAWPSAKHFCSWLGLCPGNKISGGKILSSRTKPSNNQAAKAFRLSANTLYRSKTSLGSYFLRIRSRLGAPKAITAAAHKLATILYTMLKHKKKYQELGAEYYDKKYRERVKKNLMKRASEIGYTLVETV